ncbi:PrsW family intramembrane metalloprotease [Christensenellaceae bacterium OttesenSCG-928-K19]|nr:PrsW family intramembrane metalloprotease [Christensenellaceae bacterium OttesenSCG-928-K19]
MIYAENIFMCIAAPLVIAMFLLRGDARRFVVFFTIGLAACLLAAYINNFIVNAAAGLEYFSMSAAQTTVRLTPICEEVMKALPIYFYVAVFATKRSDIVSVALAVGLGFATLENCGYIAQYGAEDVLFTLIRGFSAGVMHATCAALLGYGLAFVHGRKHFAFAGSFAFLCMAITYHAIYNLLVSADSGVRIAGYILPVATAAVLLLILRRPSGKLFRATD